MPFLTAMSPIEASAFRVRCIVRRQVGSVECMASVFTLLRGLTRSGVNRGLMPPRALESILTFLLSSLTEKRRGSDVRVREWPRPRRGVTVV
jgi:hypothetical protein